MSGNLTVKLPFVKKTTIPAEFHGQYCRAQFVNKTGIIGPIIGSNLKAGLNYGFCIPSSCDEAVLKPLIEFSKKIIYSFRKVTFSFSQMFFSSRNLQSNNE